MIESQASYESSRPQQVNALQAVNFCLQQIYDDPRFEREDEFVRDCTFEELIGALLLARDHLENEQDRQLRESTEGLDPEFDLYR